MKFTPTSEVILDYFLNLKRIVAQDELVTHIKMLTNATIEEIKSEWDKLYTEDFITVESESHAFRLSNRNLGQVENTLRESLSTRDITPDTIGNQIDHELSGQPEKLNEYVKLLGLLTEEPTGKGLWYVALGDFQWVNDPGATCDALVLKQIMFLDAWSSKKHSYRTYYLRSWPFDAYEMLNTILMKHLKIGDLSDTEWKLLFHLLISRNLALQYQVLKSIPGITESELRESITALKDKGQLIEQNNSISVVKGAYSPLIEYFCMNQYPELKKDMISKLKGRIMHNFSNSYPLMCARRLTELPIGDTKAAPIRLKIIKKSEIAETAETADMVRLGLAMDLGEDLVVLVDIVKEVENWIKGSLKSSLILIPGGDPYLASSILKDMFSKCESYVKIQDPYLGEDTFHILSTYVPAELEIRVLTSQKLGRDEDIEYFCRCIERVRSERKGKFQIFFVGDKTGEAPFHDRYIISQNRCWEIGTSLKQIGKGKDTTIVEVPTSEKTEKIEPAFDWHWSAKIKELEKKGLTRLDSAGWKATVILQG